MPQSWRARRGTAPVAKWTWLLLLPGLCLGQQVIESNGVHTFPDGILAQGQSRFTGKSGGIDVDNSLGGASQVGLVVEDDLPSPLVFGSFGPIFIGADSKGQATAVLETHNSTPGSDSVFAMRRSRGNGHGIESALQTGDIIATTMYQTWVGPGTGNAAYAQVFGWECYANQTTSSGHTGVTCKEYVEPNDTADSTMLTTRYVSNAGNTQFPQALLVGGGQSVITDPLVRLHVFENTTSASPTATEIARVEQTNAGAGLGGASNPNFSVYESRTVTTGTAQGLAGDFATTADNAYLIEARMTGRCTGGSCTAGQDIACVVRAAVKNVGGTVTVTNTAIDYCHGDVTGGTYPCGPQFAGNCTAAATPWACCTGAGTGTCNGTVQNYCGILGSAGACGTGASHVCAVVASPAATTNMSWIVTMLVTRANT